MQGKTLEKLRELVSSLGKLRDAMPENAPEYGEITRLYREASDLAERAIGIAIDAADSRYVEFSKAMPAAMKSIRTAIKKSEEIAKTIVKVAKVIEVVRKIITWVA
jgi:methyl-accepting chemotaxis protein